MFDKVWPPKIELRASMAAETSSVGPLTVPQFYNQGASLRPTPLNTKTGQ